MYSYEERLKAVKLYIQYDKSYASVFRELGYPPSNHTLKLRFKEYEHNGDLHMIIPVRRSRHSGIKSTVNPE